MALLRLKGRSARSFVGEAVADARLGEQADVAQVTHDAPPCRRAGQGAGDPEVKMRV
jgi:hypothetical protein